MSGFRLTRSSCGKLRARAPRGGWFGVGSAHCAALEGAAAVEMVPTLPQHVAGAPATLVVEFLGLLGCDDRPDNGVPKARV